MGKDKENFGDLNKLALVADGLQDLFPNGKTLIIVEVNSFEFDEIKKLTNLNTVNGKIKIDISGVEILFLLEGTIKDIDPEPEKEPEKENLLKKLKKLFGKKSS
jgi:hypothetical protein